MPGSRTTEIASLVDVLVAGTPATDAMVTVLSDLDREGMAAVAAKWTDIDADQRADVLVRAVSLVAERIDVDFTRLGFVALDDPSPVVRALGAAAFGENGGREVAERLAETLEAEEDSLVVAAAALAAVPYVLDHELGHLNSATGERLVAALRMCLEDPASSPEARAHLIEAVAPVDAEWVADVIRDAYSSDNREVRLASVLAMGQTANDEWLIFLEEQLESDDSEFRRRAAEAFGLVASQDAVEMLVPLLDDDDPEVVAATLLAFAEIGGADAVAYLEEFEDRVPEHLQDMLKEAAESARTGIVLMRPYGRES
jgi:HEAT repeat protein